MGEHPLVRTTDLSSARINLRSARRVDGATYKAWTRRAEPLAGDLIIAREAPVGGVGIVPPGVEPVLGQRTMLLRPNAAKVNPRYLMYLLAAPEMQQQMAALSNGATVPHLNLGDIRAMRVPPLPARDEQDRVATLLSALDGYGETCEERIEVVKEMARLLYREWFVHFRFPGHETSESAESELGTRIPEGWSIEKLFDIADVGFGYSFKSAQFSSDGPFPVIRIRDVPRGRTSTFTDEVADERYRVVDGDVLIGMDGDFHMAMWTGGEAWLNQRVNGSLVSARRRCSATTSCSSLCLTQSESGTTQSSGRPSRI
jgi:type I restriction enzyme S subunit